MMKTVDMTNSTNNMSAVSVLQNELSNALPAHLRKPKPAGAQGNRSLVRPTQPTSATWFSRRRKVPQRDVFSFTMQLAIMTRAGVDLASALESLARQCRSERLKDTLQRIHADVCDGKSVSEALRQHSDVFGPT